MEYSLTVYANPYAALDAYGRPMGAVAYPGAHDRFIGAEVDAQASEQEGVRVFSFSHEPVSITFRGDRGHADYMHVLRLVQHGDLIAGDEVSARKAGIVRWEVVGNERRAVKHDAERDLHDAAARAIEGYRHPYDEHPDLTHPHWKHVPKAYQDVHARQLAALKAKAAPAAPPSVAVHGGVSGAVAPVVAAPAEAHAQKPAGAPAESKASS